MGRKKRNPYINNVRIVLVFLVVFGHLISPFKDNNEFIYFINNFLASFRMPALIVLTGFFAKNFNGNGYVEKITVKLFVPYMLFQFLYTFEFTLSINWFNPNMGLWFLLSLYCWNLMLFIFNRLKHPIVISIILGIGIGLVDDAGHYLSISRTFVFFPFFLLGLYANESFFAFFHRKKAKLLSLFSLVVAIVVMNLIPLSITRGLLLGRSSYFTLELTDLEGALLRGLFYLIMLLGIFAFMPWVPKKKILFTYYGQKTAYIYVLHLAIIGLIYQTNWFNEYSIVKFFLSPIIALCISTMLCSKLVLFVSKPFVEGRIIYDLRNIYVVFLRNATNRMGGVQLWKLIKKY